MSTSGSPSKIGRFFDMKRQGEPITVLTAYDAPTARAEEDAGIDLILVGDSVGTNVLGYVSEREVTLDDIAHHVRAVRRGAPDTPVLADLPYATYDDVKAALVSAHRLVASGADMVKLEGFCPDIVAALVEAGIPVCGHLGLECQHHDEKRLKAKTASAALRLEADAVKMAKAGLSLLVLELIPETVAARITKAIDVPTIGIGAGRGTDGQVLVITDVLGVTKVGFRHNRRFAELGTATRDAALAYVQAVRTRQFPAKENVFVMAKTELALIEDEG